MSSDQTDLRDSKQPLLSHLSELRSRLIKTLIMLTVFFVIFYIFADNIYNFLVQPYANAVEGEHGRRLIFTALHETFFTYLKVALFASLFLSLPYVLTQIWIFMCRTGREQSVFFMWVKKVTFPMIFSQQHFIYSVVMKNTFPT